MKIVWQLMATGLCLAVLVGAPRAQSNGEVLTAGVALVTESFVDAAGGRGALTGKLSLERVRGLQSGIVADALLVGIATNSTGEVIGQVREQFVLPVTTRDVSCGSLRLDVGPAEIVVVGRPIALTTVSWTIRARGAREPEFDQRLCRAADAIASQASPVDVGAALEALVHPIR